MGKKDNLLDDLLDEMVEIPQQAPVKRREVSEIPDALVLVEIKTTCMYCSTEWTHPNPHILGRYGRHHKRIKKWTSYFEQLPRERLELKEQATGCMNCFEYGVFRTWEMEEGG